MRAHSVVWLMTLLGAASARAAAGEPPDGGAVDGPTLKATASLTDGLKVESSDGNYGVQAGALMWARASLGVSRSATGANEALFTDEFAVPLVRPYLKAHLLRPWFSVFLQPEIAGPSPKLLDFEVDVHPLDELGVKVGQFITPFGRSFMSPVPKLQLQGFALASEVFRANRDTGVMVYGAALGGRLEYFAGGFNGNGIGQPGNDDSSLLWVGRLAGTLFGRPPSTKGHVKYDETVALAGDCPPTLMLGVNGYTNRTTPAVTSAAPVPASSTVDTAGADLAFAWRRVFAQAEGFLQRTTPDGGTLRSRWGWDAQVGVFVLPGRLEVAARASMVRFAVDDPSSWLTQADAQLAWYLAGNHVKALLRYTFTDAGSAQRGFSTGLTHGAVAQLQLWL